LAKKKPGGKSSGKTRILEVKEEFSVTSVFIKAALFGVLFLPLVFFPPLYDIYDLSKVTVLRLLTIAVVCLWVVHTLSRKKIEIPRTNLALPAAVLLLIILLSTVFSVNPVLSILGGIKRHEGLPTYFSYLLIFWLSATFFSKRESLKVETILGVAVIIQSIYGIFQRLGYDVINWGNSGYDVTRAFGSTGNPVFLGQYLALVTPFLIAQIIYSETDSKFRNIFRVTAAALAVTCALFTYSRASWVGIAFALLFLVPVFMYKVFYKTFKRYINEDSKIKKGKKDLSKIKESVKPLVLAFSILIGVIMLVLFVTTRPSPTSGTASGGLAERAKSTVSVGEGTAGTRISMWASTLKIIKEKPVIGYGLETFKGIFPRYRELILIRLEGEMSMPDRPHNEPLYLIYSWGILGFTAFLWILIAFCWKSTRYLLSKDPSAIYKGFVVSALVAVIGYNAADFFSFSTANSTPTYWLLMGFASSLMWSGNSRSISLPSPPKEFKFLMYSLLIVWAAVFSWFSFQFPLADLHYNRARFARAYGDLENARNEGEAAVGGNQYQALYRIELATIYQALYEKTKDPQWATKNYYLFNSAVKFDPRDQDSWANLGSSLLGSNANMPSDGVEKAISYYKNATTLDPYFSLANQQLSSIYLSRGKYNEARPYLEKLVEVQPSSAFGLSGLGRVYETVDKQRAGSFYSKALQIDPNNQASRDGLARISK
jgi:O-antigen ligase